MAPLEEHVRHQRRTALLGAALIAPFAAVDLAQPASPDRIAIALIARAAWAAALLVGAKLLSRRPPRLRASAAVMAAASAAAPITIVGVTGGTQSGYFAFLLALSFCMVVLLPGHVVAATASGAAGIFAGALLLVDAGATTLDVVRWVGTGLGLSTLAVYGTHVGGILMRREIEAAHSRAEAADALARSERRRATVERLAIVGRLAAGVAHEINNPLGYVKANLSWVRSELACSSPPDRDEVDAALAETALGVERIGRIVADLRGFAREDGDEPCGTPLTEAIREALRLASVRTRGMRLRVDAPPSLPLARICRKRLVQVLVNLVVNAADAVEEARRAPADRWIAVSARSEGGALAVRVEDAGRGIPEVVLPHLFEPFFTTKPPGAGTGLGLALSHEYVTAVGGTITGRNGSRGGAVFEILLPQRNKVPGCTSCARAGIAPAPPRAAGATA